MPRLVLQVRHVVATLEDKESHGTLGGDGEAMPEAAEGVGTGHRASRGIWDGSPASPQLLVSSLLVTDSPSRAQVSVSSWSPPG